MLTEITQAADFLVNMLRMSLNQRRSPGTRNMTENQLGMLKGTVSRLLQARYRNHWFPQCPNKGSGYRCIRINHTTMDPVISHAGKVLGIQPQYLRNLFSFELTIWIDPEEVSYRIGENGSICILYEGPNEAVAKAPCQSPELYEDPRQYEQPDPMVDFV